jgi:ABC-type antimicrobial peptide transport system permease subunit
MKNYFKLLVSGLLIVLSACTKTSKVEPGTYVDLNTGDSISVIADPETGYAVNSETKKPVYLYVNNNRDTIFTTGAIVNNKINRVNDDYYEIDIEKVTVDDKDVTIKYADYKKKVDGDDYKIKDGDYKLKVEGDGDSKLKDGDYKKKVSEDGDVKIKDGDSKTKIEDGVVKKEN